MKIKAECMKDLEGMGFVKGVEYYEFAISTVYSKVSLTVTNRQREISLIGCAEAWSDEVCIAVNDEILKKYYDLIKAGMVEE